MNLNSPLVEYLIIGSHSSIWISLFTFKLFNIPLNMYANADAGKVLLLLPIIYLIGMLIDVLSYFPLDFFRKRIRSKIYDPEICKDEYIAHLSPKLYDVYEARVRRVRILGASILNWPLIGIAIIYSVNAGESQINWTILLITAFLTFLSAYSWQSLYKRAYKFRKNACEALQLAKK